MTRFTEYLASKSGRSFPDYNSLHRWSIEDLESFWHSLVEFSGLIYTGSSEPILESAEMPGAQWFPQMKLNYAENVLGRNYHGTAVKYITESGPDGEPEARHAGEHTFEELTILTARCARSLRQAGVRRGDRVAGYVANVPEAVIACLACASIGATWCSASPDFGLAALCERFVQVEPKLLFASTHYVYGNKTFPTTDVVSQLKNRIGSLEKIISIPFPVGECRIPGDLVWDEFLGPDDDPDLEFEQVSFDHPLLILFSSGTTGAPKCIVHGTGGTLLQHRKELQLHCNLNPGDSLLYFTTCGWMMWNWQLSALSLGATLCLFDGNPGYPDLSAIWHLVDEQQISHFGTSGRFLEACMKSQPELSLTNACSFESLGTLLYTGSPLSAEGFRWVYEQVKKDVHLAGISGGTDIVSCFILGNPNLPVRAGEIQCKGLAVDVVAFGERAEILQGKPGELVCRQSIPSMPIGFLNDPGGKKYHDAYFDVYPGIWRHGDFVEFTESGGAVVYGRSDTTLNPGGVRIGSAEIYSALDSIKEITGSVVVGWVPPNESDEVIVLLVVLAEQQKLDTAFRNTIRQTIRTKYSPRHVPKHIFQISEVPVTRSGKTVELSVKAILAGNAISNRNALANPQILEAIEQVRRDLHLLYS